MILFTARGQVVEIGQSNNNDKEQTYVLPKKSKWE